MTGKQLINALKKVVEVEHAFRFPYAYIRCISQEFEGKELEEREDLVSQKTGYSIPEIRKTAADCLFTLEWLTSSEAKAQPIINQGEHWLKAFLDEPLPAQPTETTPKANADGVKVVHFFGYKGGQGRSTVLSCLAQKLASEGVKVLILDADIEAPSLDIIFGVKANSLGSTLLGIVRKLKAIQAIPVIQGNEGGEARLIACRPQESAYDLDFAAFAMQANMFPGVLKEAVCRISEWAKSQEFNIILVDHRSGMAMTTLTWMHLLPGPAVLFSKMDEQWRGAEGVFREVLGANPTNPGIVVSFKPDEENPDTFKRRTAQQRSDLLGVLNSVMEKAFNIEEDSLFEDFTDPSNVEDRWILWSYDPAFRSTTLPDIQSLTELTKKALSEIIRLLEIRLPEKKQLSSIGSVDEGNLIQTDAFIKLKQPGNTIRYIFGRKGTGKTRLATELAKHKLGLALLVDSNSDAKNDGLTTADLVFTQARDLFSSSPESLWWAILLAAMQGKTTERKALSDRLTVIVNGNPSLIELRQKVAELLRNSSTENVYILDGIETAFDVSNVYFFVEKLFAFMLTLQADDQFAGHVEIKLFLRTDLAKRSMEVQNFEQQIDGRVLYLFWDYQRILNFMLSRILLIPFFKQYYSNVVDDIEKLLPKISKAEVSTEACEEVLQKVFPYKLQRFNILTSTFLRLHFADSSAQGEPAYYPRVIDAFLTNLGDLCNNKGDEAISTGRIDQKLMVQAHEKASVEYMAQIRQELQYLLNFGVAAQEANSMMSNWIHAFSGEKTPFDVLEMTNLLAARTNLDSLSVRKCLEQMQAIGIFEFSASSPNKWRIGRLYKAALKMKFNRSGEEE